MFDRLVGRTVLAHTNRVVSEGVHNPKFGQCCQPHRGSAVVAEHEERATNGKCATMKGHAVHHCSHGMLADAIVDLVSAQVVGRYLIAIVELHAGVASEVSAAGNEAWPHWCDRIEHRIRRFASGDIGAWFPGRQRSFPITGGFTSEHGVRVGVGGGPVGSLVSSSASGLAVPVEYFVAYLKGLGGIQPELCLCCGNFVVLERVTVGRGRVGQRWAGCANVGL